MTETTETAAARRLLVADDEPDICDIVAEVAEYLGFQVAAVHEATEFESVYRKHQPHVVVLDLNMPRVDGIELLRFIAGERHDTAVLLMSGVDRRTLASAERLGTTHGLRMLGALQKPIQITTLEEALTRAFPED